MCQILVARKNQCLIVNEKEQDILVGSILGDACVLKKGMIQFEHGQKQKEYLEWKYEQLKSIVSGTKIYETKRFRNNRTWYYYKFTTRQFFRSWREKFYPFGIKTISSGIIENLNPLSLAVWYMDDGCLRNNYSCIISTDAFDDESIERLRSMLDKKYEIKTRVRKKKSYSKKEMKIQKRIYIGGSNMVNFFDLIRPFIIPSMKYKITDPVTTQSIKRRNISY